MSPSSSHGGGSSYTPPVTYEVFNGAPTNIGNGTTVKLPWTTSAGPDTLLNLASPTQPSVLVAGVYAVHGIVLVDDAMTVGGYCYVTLRLTGSVVRQAQTDGLSTAANQFPDIPTLTAVLYLGVADTIELSVTNHDGVNAINFELDGSFVQRLS